MIKVFKNFIPEDLVSEINRYTGSRAKSNVWSISNLTYSQDLVEGSTPIFCMSLHEDIVKKIIKLYTKQFKEFKNKKFNMDYKIYSPNSYITWHGDNEYLAGSTIYLNKEYYENDGGIFLYKDEKNDIRGLEPTYRSMVLNYKDKNRHCVTAISPRPRFLRETIQIFIKR
jgi:hypothetical protein